LLFNPDSQLIVTETLLSETDKIFKFPLTLDNNTEYVMHLEVYFLFDLQTQLFYIISLKIGNSFDSD